MYVSEFFDSLSDDFRFGLLGTCSVDTKQAWIKKNRLMFLQRKHKEQAAASMSLYTSIIHHLNCDRKKRSVKAADLFSIFYMLKGQKVKTQENKISYNKMFKNKKGSQREPTTTRPFKSSTICKSANTSTIHVCITTDLSHRFNKIEKEFMYTAHDS